MEDSYIKLDCDTIKSILSLGIRINADNGFVNYNVLIDKLKKWYIQEYVCETDREKKHNYDLQLCFIANALAGVRKRNEFIRCLSIL